jgi:O-antigen ligase
VLNYCETPFAENVSASERPTRLDWAIALFLAIVQQGAFIFTAFEVLHPGEAIEGDIIFHTISIAMSIVLLAICSARALPQLRSLFLRNPYAILYILIALSSAIWSLHPDLTIKRGITYVLTIGVAGFIAARFTTEQALKVLAMSFQICALASVIFIVLSPDIAFMHGGEYSGQELEGNLKGVYPHKNICGFTMAIAVFVQLLLISISRKHSISSYAWIVFYFVLVLLSKATTALIITMSYFLFFIIYTVWTKNKLYGYNLLFFVVVAAAFLAMAFLMDEEVFFGLIGKDPTLTGRTDVWSAVSELIYEKPVFGWGYGAMWVPTDQVTMWVDRKCGDWGVPSAHNAMLEIALELGLLGVSALVILIVQAFWRGLRCCLVGQIPLGLFSLVFYTATIIAGQTIETLGIAQLDWLVFTMLSFIAGERLAQLEASAPSVRVKLSSELASERLFEK